MNGWFDVKEKLPNHGDDIMMYVEATGQIAIGIFYKSNEGKNQFIADGEFEEFSYHAEQKSVTHWRRMIKNPFYIEDDSNVKQFIPKLVSEI